MYSIFMNMSFYNLSKVYQTQPINDDQRQYTVWSFVTVNYIVMRNTNSIETKVVKA